MMRGKKNARPDVGASKRAKEPGQASRQGRASIHNDTTSPPPGQRVSDYLLHGPENGITLRRLGELTNLPSREIRRQIEQERRAGALIISDNQHGYFLTDDPVEAQRFVRSMRHRAREILRTARAIEGAAGLG